MPIILPLGRTVKAYLQQFEFQGPDLRVACPYCSGATHEHGRYWRSAVTGREVYRIPIYRRRCAACGRTTALLPDFLVPYAQFVSLVREAVLRLWLRGWPVAEVVAQMCRAAGGLSERTVLRWLARLRERAAGWTQVLTERLLLAHPGSDVFSPGSRWKGRDTMLRALCGLGDLCRMQVPSGQGHPGLFAYCSGLAARVPRL